MSRSVLGLVLFLFSCSLFAGGLGVNISLPERGGTFIDVVKEHHRWLTTDWSPLDNSDFDERGWPTRDAMLLIDARPVAEWAGEIDDPEAYRVDWGGVYSGSFSGRATVQSKGQGVVSNVSYDEASNKTTFSYNLPSPNGDGYGFFALAFTQTRRSPSHATGTGITDLRLIRPGYKPDTQKIFTDEFIYSLMHPHFAAIRYMPFTGTNGTDPEYPAVMEWKDRKLPTDASQVGIPAIGKPFGAAWEYVIELSNITHTDPWINVPVSATTDYVTQLATMFKDNLDPDLNVYVESSNEVWNSAPGFEQTEYNKQQAEDRGIDWRENHARRTVELAQIFASVYGKGSLNNKVRVILCTHAPMLKWWLHPMMDYIQKTFGEPNQFIWAIACQTYFGGGHEEGESVEKILSDCRDSITNQMDEKSGNQAGRKQWIAYAAELGLPGGFCSYEGGPDHGGGSTTNIANRIMAERDPGMAEVFKYNIDDAFWQLGGNLAMQFTLSSAYNRYGCWGLTDDITKPDRNYKFQAARELIAASGVAQHETPTGYALYANYPNPFNPGTSIDFEIPKKEFVRLEIYTVEGKRVTTLAAREFTPGKHTLVWDGAFSNGTAASSGVYLYRLFTSQFTKTRTMVLLR